MSRKDVLDAIQKYRTNPAFAADMKANAEEAMQKEGFGLSPLEHEVLGKIDWNWTVAQVNRGISWMENHQTDNGWDTDLQALSGRLDQYWQDRPAGLPLAPLGREDLGMVWI